MPDLHYLDSDLAPLYDIDSGWSDDRTFYRNLPKGPRQRILDIGCGTGLISAAYAQDGHLTTGVDPAAAMLDVARKRTGGGSVRWIEGTARSAPRTDFDLIIMTGHAFQVLLTDEEVADLFDEVKARLDPTARFVFETRNPRLDWASRWNASTQLESEGTRIPLDRIVAGWQDDVLTFDTHYDLPTGRKTSRSSLRFLEKDMIAKRLSDAGLQIVNLWGDWHYGSFEPTTSEEIVFEIRLDND